MAKMLASEVRPHVGIYGRANVGKSALLNALTGQRVAIVSEHAGTTTDPVRKAAEIRGGGPVVFIDTAGFNDHSALGKERMAMTIDTMRQVDLALLLFRGDEWGEPEQEIVSLLRKYETPFLLVATHADEASLSPTLCDKLLEYSPMKPIEVGSTQGMGIETLLSAVAKSLKAYERPRGVLDGLVRAGDVVLLIAPIDDAAPQGRLILPQVQTLRAALDCNAIPVIVRETEIAAVLSLLQRKPALAVTDSQIFSHAAEEVPEDIPLTSFSMLLARQKGEFETYLRSAPAIDGLKKGDRVLIVEGCTHQVSCEDIGRVKIPGWINQRAGGELRYDFVSGMARLPEGLSQYSLALICGGCMSTPRMIRGRVEELTEHGVPVVNYGMAIAYLQGVYERAVSALTGGAGVSELYR